MKGASYQSEMHSDYRAYGDCRHTMSEIDHEGTIAGLSQAVVAL